MYILLKIFCSLTNGIFHCMAYIIASLRRYWCDQKEQRAYLGPTLYPQKLNAWAGILGDYVIGPFFIKDTYRAFADQCTTELYNSS